jgi:NAD(P)-dependent dehydrogenase (short-subunit alcohol dehydrogenase family)
MGAWGSRERRGIFLLDTGESRRRWAKERGMKSNIAIVTGANRGIGKRTASKLASLGYTVVMACRNLQTALSARDEIRSASGNTNVDVLELDLADFASVRGFVRQFGERYESLNVLVNNAGITSKNPGKTVDGLDIVVGTNYFGPFLLTQLLIDKFEHGGDNRIINLTSNIYPYGRFNFQHLQDYRWVKSYAVSKYMVLLFSLELAERQADSGITVNAVHPGIVDTDIMFTHEWYDAIIDALLKPFFISPEIGAAPVVKLATSADMRGITGRYFSKFRLARVPSWFSKPKLRRRLYEYSESITGTRLP